MTTPQPPVPVGGTIEMQQLVDRLFPEAHIDAKSTLLTAIAALEAQVPQWRDIETAPKDGTAILLHDNDAPGLPSGHADRCDGTNTYVAAWWEGAEAWICYMDAVLDPRCPIEPTHWMPLPPSPTGP